MRRQKRKAASLQLNFVDYNPKKKFLSIKKASYPVDGIAGSSKSDNCSSSTSARTVVSPPVDITDDGTDTQPPPTETHTQRKTKAAEVWAEVRSSLASSYMALFGFPSTSSFCVFCGVSVACVWCLDCGPSAYFCEECATKLHSSINVFHNPLLWKEVDRVFTLFPRKVTIPARCTCSSTYHRELTCVNEKGCFHAVRVTFCSCESEAVTLISAGLFPATPKVPKLAFTFTLLDLFEALLLECQVSAQDFVAAVKVLSDAHINQTTECQLYPVIIDCFEEYRHMKYTHRHMKVIVPGRVNDGTKCPACPRDGQVFYSIDGNFGLCRKKSSGNSVRPPLHENTIFMNQEAVDHYVGCYGKMKALLNKECNQFLASDVLRSKSRYKGLDETGVVGVVCRHEFPLIMMSMRHGERLSYIVYALERVLECSQQYREKAHLLYDVACTLHRHLQIQGRHDLLGYFELAVPVFHSYGHKVDCQFQYSPRNKSGFGLTDGEVVERLWSYLRRFSRMTKEMRPSHRIDVLTDALLHYAQHSTNRFCNLLPLRIEKAKGTQYDCKKELEQLVDNSSVKFSTADINQWYEDECKLPQSHSTYVEDDETSWEVNYFTLLDTYYNTRCEMETCTQNCIRAVTRSLNKLDTELKAIEQRYQVERWACDSDVFQDHKRLQQTKQRKKIATDIETCARERWFLLNMKAKFADGQYMASRLSKTINRESIKMKKVLSQYNALVTPGHRVLTWTEATDLCTSIVHECTHSSDIEIPRKIRLLAIKNHHLAIRADEEVQIITDEMKSSFSFFLSDWKCLSSAVLELKSRPCSKFHNGALYQVYRTQLRCESILLKMKAAFSLYVRDLPDLPVDQFQTANAVQYPPLDELMPTDSNLFNFENEPVVGAIPETTNDAYNEDEEDERQELNDETWSSDEELAPENSTITETFEYRGTIPPVTFQPSLSGSGSHMKQDTPTTPVSSRDNPLTLVPAGTAATHQPESDYSDCDDFFPSLDTVNKRILRFEREEFLKQQTQQTSELELGDEENQVLAQISKTPSGHVSQKGFLQRDPDQLKKVVKSAMKYQPPSGPHFISRK